MRVASRTNPRRRGTRVASPFLLMLFLPTILTAAPPHRDVVQPVVPLKVVPFDLEQVRLLPGPFRHAMELDEAYLLKLDPDRLLHTFRLNAGLPSTAKPLGGWEAPDVELHGHFMGHYLSACALMYASTGDERFKERGEALVKELAECQRKIGSGYLSAFPEEFIARVERRERVWAPWYTLHKLLAGLLDMNTHCQSALALDCARKFGDWVKARTDRLSDDQMQGMLRTEHGGMNESLANLFARTGDANYLKLAERFNHREVLQPASQGRDTLTGLHANTQIPKFLGTAREFELTGKEPFQTASKFFWDTVVKERSYVIGGHSDGEMFTAKERLSRALGPNTTETCNTYNMLKLTRHLFAWDPRAEYADYYERALYNHILASQNPETGMMCYYVPLRSGTHKVYNNFDADFWCCTGTGVENHAKYGDSIYFHEGDQALYVNLFIASELKWDAKGLTVRQETAYPAEQSTRLRITCDQPAELLLKIRHPAWLHSGFAIKLNGEAMETQSTPGSYADIRRTWRSGDTIDVALPFALHSEGFRDNPHRRAILHGPLVLAANVERGQQTPDIVAEEDGLLQGLQPVAGRPSTFTDASGLFRRPGAGESVNITLQPFYLVHGPQPYVVYWDLYAPAQWPAREAAFATEQAHRKELDRRTVDQVRPGDRESERAHQFAGQNSSEGELSDLGWRDASDGWFSYVLKVRPDQAQNLSVTYWGSDSGQRRFDILVDGTRLVTERLDRNRPEQFYDQAYALPAELTRGKNQVTVTFKAHPGNLAGGVFGLRVLTPR